jgi:hypothetical protein
MDKRALRKALLSSYVYVIATSHSKPKPLSWLARRNQPTDAPSKQKRKSRLDTATPPLHARAHNFGYCPTQKHQAAPGHNWQRTRHK